MNQLLTHCILIDYFILFDTINLEYFIVHIKECQVIIFQTYGMMFCRMISFTFTNIVGPVEMQHYAAFHMGLHCLQKYSFRGFSNT